jgi:hypothetical protein
MMITILAIVGVKHRCIIILGCIYVTNYHDVLPTLHFCSEMYLLWRLATCFYSFHTRIYSMVNFLLKLGTFKAFQYAIWNFTSWFMESVALYPCLFLQQSETRGIQSFLLGCQKDHNNWKPCKVSAYTDLQALHSPHRIHFVQYTSVCTGCTQTSQKANLYNKRIWSFL